MLGGCIRRRRKVLFVHSCAVVCLFPGGVGMWVLKQPVAVRQVPLSSGEFPRVQRGSWLTCDCTVRGKADLWAPRG